jgi:hypothetical protein
MVAIGALCAWYRAKGAEPGSRKNHSIADLPTLQGADTA